MISNLYLGRQAWPIAPDPALPLQNNEVATRALITHGDKVLLVWQSNFNQWWLPGGRIRPGDNLVAGVLREIAEETALEVKLGDMVGLFDAIVRDRGMGCNKHMFHFIFAATPTSAPDFDMREHIDTDHELDTPGTVTKIGWFNLEQLKTMDNLFPACIANWPEWKKTSSKTYYGTKLEDGCSEINNIERFYISSRVVATHNNRILMVYNGKGDFWFGPGGQIEFGEDLYTCATREVMEETGLEARARDVIAVDEFYSPTYKLHQINLYTRCELATDALPAGWQDTAQTGHVAKCAFLTQAELAAQPRAYPVYMAELAWPALVKQRAA
jgi:8-oxo-dGTP diphosphatase